MTCAHRYTELMDRAIGHLRKTGYLDRLKSQWWAGRGDCGGSGSSSGGGGGARISRMYGSVYISCAHTARRYVSAAHRLSVAALPLAVVAHLRH